MTQHLFSQNTIAMVWDFDKTLIPGYMQEPLFDEYGVDKKRFWAEVAALPVEYKSRGVQMISSEIVYLNHILSYARAGTFAGLNNRKLKKLGERLSFFPGLPDLFSSLQQRLAQCAEYQRHEITLEHYIVSSGLRQMIVGSEIAPFVEGVWGCELLEGLAAGSVVCQLGYVLDNTSKTRALFEINKGSNKHPEIDVNGQMNAEDRRIPFQNMIYIADGPSDVPVFSLLNSQGGKTFAVYAKGSEAQFKQVNSLQQQGRVNSYGEADYRQGSQTCMWLQNALDEIAARMVKDRERVLGEKVGDAPQHLSE